MGLLNFLRHSANKIFVRTDSKSFNYTNATLADNETIFSAVTMLANAVASAPISVRQDYVKLSPKENNIARLCEYGFNSNMTTFKFIQSMEVLRNITGAAYAIKEYGLDGEVETIWLMKTENVTPIIEKDTKELYYRVRDDKGDIYIHNSHIIAVSHISTDGINPINPLNVLKNSLDYDREVKEFSINQMKNGMKVNYVIKVTGAFSNKKDADGKTAFDYYDEIISKFKKQGILYLDNGKSVEELKGNSLIDPKVFEVEEITIARVARVYTIPLGKMLSGKNSYASAEQADLEYLKDTILPIIRMYEQAFSRGLLSEFARNEGIQVKMSLNGFARADMKTRGDFYFKGIRSSWFCANEIRGLEDMGPILGGDVFYVSRDLVPINMAGKEGDENK